MSILAKSISQTIDAVNTSIQIVETTLENERAALQYDRFGRCASEMPPSLRHLYETGRWRNQDVYLWPSVLSLSVTGHHLADAADAALDRLRYHPSSPISIHSSISEVAIRDAATAVAIVSPHVRSALLAARRQLSINRRRDYRAYMHRRRLWNDRLKQAEQCRPVDVADRMRQRDRELLVATRAPSGMGASMTVREIDLIFAEIEAAGGTAGGNERWGRSIAAIPTQNPHNLSSACHGGGILIENPLAYHYASRNINPWTRVERLMFLEKFLMHGKNFRKIAQYFEHKSCEDVVRFYFDNKKQLKLKQLVKDQSTRKKGAKKTALLELSRLPMESRSIRDNFIYQEGFESDDDDSTLDWGKADPFSGDAVARSWTPPDRRALIFALCRYDVTQDNGSESSPTVWTNVSALVGNKTPRQCRDFYFHFKTALGLDGYQPPKTGLDSSKRTEPSDVTLEADVKPEVKIEHGLYEKETLSVLRPNFMDATDESEVMKNR